MPVRRGVGSLLAVGLVLGACGGDSDGGVGDLREVMEALPEDTRTEEQRQAVRSPRWSSATSTARSTPRSPIA